MSQEEIRAQRLKAEWDRAFFGDTPPLIGLRARAASDVHFDAHTLIPLTPYTRWQRLLHRIGVHRWHRHSDGLTIAKLDEMMDALR